MTVNRIGAVVIGLLVLSGKLYANDGNLTVNGDGRIRLRYVQADKDTLTGSYGEVLKKGIGLRQRLDLCMNLYLNQYLNVDVGLRISNEDVKSTQVPPDNLSTIIPFAWWSVNLEKSPWEITVGSYETSFTPLTLMRWDTKDNPLAASGCACQISVGGITGESLEEPQEDYRFEGLKFESKIGYGDLKIIFARPQLESEGSTYARYMYGVRTRVIPVVIGASHPISLGLSALRVQDDMNSVTGAVLDPLQSDVVGMDADIPLLFGCHGVGEYAYSIRDDNLGSPLDEVRKENGIMGGLRFEQSDIMNGDLFYLRLDPYFSPLYRALSYARNRQGFRTSFTYRKLPVPAKSLAISVYLKGLREIKPTWYGSISEWHHTLSDILIGNLALNVMLTDNIKSEVDFEYRRTLRADDPLTLALETLDETTQIFSVGFSYEFTFQSKLTLKYQFINNIDDVGNNDFIAHMPSLQLAIKF